MATITDEQITEWKRLADAATPGPWRWEPTKHSEEWFEDETGAPYVPQGAILGDTLIQLADTYENSRHDCAFIAAAREAVPALRAEVERLRAAAGERDALREALQGMVDEFQHMARPGRAYINVDDALQAAEILDKANAALAAVPAPPPPQADDRLAWAEAGAKAMRIAAMTALAVGPYEEGGDEYAIIAALDPAAVARRAVEEQEKQHG